MSFYACFDIDSGQVIKVTNELQTSDEFLEILEQKAKKFLISLGSLYSKDCKNHQFWSKDHFRQSKLLYV